MSHKKQYGLSLTEKQAMVASSTPTSTNPFATINDVPKAIVGQVTFSGNNGIGKQNVTAVTSGLVPAVGDTIVFTIGYVTASGIVAAPLTTGTAVGATLVNNTGSPAVNFLTATDYSPNGYVALLAR